MTFECVNSRSQEVKNGPMRDSAPEPVENTQDAYATMTGGPSLLVLLGFLNSRLLDSSSLPGAKAGAFAYAKNFPKYLSIRGIPHFHRR